MNPALHPFTFHPDLLPLAASALAAIGLMFWLGKRVGRVWLGGSARRAFGPSQLLAGFIGLSALCSVLVVGFNTILVPIALVFAGLVWFSRYSSGSESQLPARYGEQVGLLMGGFLLFFLFRVYSIHDFDTGLWRLMLKDDIHYIEVLNYLGHYRVENVPYELGKQAFALTDVQYQPYHYITFSIALFLKKWIGIGSFELFHFFICPFLEMLGLFGLYELCRNYGRSVLFSLMLSLAVISTLRYSFVDEWLHLFHRNKLLSNFFGFQFLNSGFGFKFCFTLFVLAVAMEQFRRLRPAALSILPMLNPIYLVFNAWICGFYLFFNRKIFLQVAAGTFAALVVAVIFYRANDVVQSPMDMAAVWREVLALKGPVSLILISYSNFILNFYTLLFLPAVAIVLYRKRWPEKALGVILLLAPVYHDWFAARLFTLIYFGMVAGLTGWLLLKHRYKEETLFLLTTIAVFLVGSELALVLTDLNQVFLFILYGAVFYSAALILVRTVKGSGIWTVLFFLLLVHNVHANFAENRFRTVPLSSNPAYLKTLQHLVAKYDPARAGYYDSHISHPFMNQYFIGEELLLCRDTLFATPVRLPKLDDSSAAPQRYFLTKLPLTRYMKAHGPITDTLQTTLEFMRNCGMGVVAVMDYDKERFRPVLQHFTDSLANEPQGYTLYFRKEN